MPKLRWSFLVAGAMASCGALPSIPCDGDYVLTASVAQGVQRADFAVAGVARHDGEWPARWVAVEGIRTAPKADGSYSVTLPLSVAQARADAWGVAAIAVATWTECDSASETLSVEVQLDPTPADEVHTMELTAVPDADREWLPADGSATATVSLVADVGAVGKSAAVSAVNGSLSASSLVFMPAADGDGHPFGAAAAAVRSSATVAAGSESTLTVQAVAGGLTRTASLRLAGAPAFGTGNAEIEAGTAASYEAWSAVGIEACRATVDPLADVEVYAGASRLTESPTGETYGWVPMGVETVRFDLVTSAEVPGSTRVTLTCRDAAGQLGERALSIVAPAEEAGAETSEEATKESAG